MFYQHAYNAMNDEIKKIWHFTEQLEQNPSAKSANIAEYKCAKYRYAAIQCVLNAFKQCYDLRDKLYATHYVLLPYHQDLEKNPDFIRKYNASIPEHQPDLGLYYGISAYAAMLIGLKKNDLSGADDWETIKLNEYINGYTFAKQCLDEAWSKYGKEPQ